jgi:hypothetical protein
MMEFPATRQSVLQRLDEFLEDAPHYAARRNHVLPGHPQVSRLSAAIRHRLITEAEVVEAALQRYPFRVVENFFAGSAVARLLEGVAGKASAGLGRSRCFGCRRGS